MPLLFLFFSRLWLTFVAVFIRFIMATLSFKRFLCTLLMSLLLVQMAAARRIGVLLPFGAPGKVGQTMVEFYRGFLMAADSVRAEGVSLEIYALDSGTTPAEMSDVLSRGSMAEMDCIVGPAVPAQAMVLANFCKQRGIQLLMPFNTPVEAGKDYPSVFENVAPQEVTYAGVSQLLLENFPDANYVFLVTGRRDTRGTALQQNLKKRLDAYGLYYRTLDVSVGYDAIPESLEKAHKNVILIDSPDEATLGSLSSYLLTLKDTHPACDVSLVGFPEWLSFGSRITTQLHALDAYVFSTFYSNPLAGHALRFNQSYQGNFGQQPLSVNPSIAMTGFDLGLFAMQSTGVKPLQHGFAFRQESTNGPYINHFVQLVHFQPNKIVNLMR